jgi:type I restriction enzyme, R subunit
MPDDPSLSLLGDDAPLGDPNETLFEETTVERLKALGYEHYTGSELRGDRFPETDVVHRPTLRAYFETAYPHLTDEAIRQAVQRVAGPDGVSLSQRNKHFHEMATQGFGLAYEKDDGKEAHEHVYPVDWETPETNTFWVVQQLSVQGSERRRPDLVVYVNGLPLVVFELKNPYAEEPTVRGAHKQIQAYTKKITRLFAFNAFCVISDGEETLHGVHSASMEWFNPWKSIDGHTTEGDATGSMKTLVEGLFPPKRLLAYIRHFIVHEQTGGGILKKGALYHQFFGVRFAVNEAIRATQPEGDRKIGVVWHTQGAGKSLSMVFFVGILRKRLGNPTILIEVDRNDLDEQLHDAFVAARQMVGTVHQAQSVDDLRTRLQTEGGEVVFSTIEKFRLKDDEREHPELSDRNDIIVIADEAHRTQYGFEASIRYSEAHDRHITAYGYAQYLRQALPNASFIGFTGTPIEEGDRDTTAVFGDIIHTYDLTQAQADGAIVEIRYEPRLVDLRLINEQIDDDLAELEVDGDMESEKLKWVALEEAAGATPRLEKLSADLIEHYERRTELLFGKGMIVCMSRRNCVRLFDQIIERRPEWFDPAIDRGEIKIVMTGKVSKDPPAWNEAGHITTKGQRDQLKDRFKDPDDPLKLVIVCDMWLTGTNIPCLHTLYVDKPMKGHNLMQAIARVNRVFRDKPSGLVVDYIGISTELKKATKRYTENDFGRPAEELGEEALAQFHAALETVRETLPEDVDASDWRSLSKVAFEDMISAVYAHYTRTVDERDDFLQKEKRLSTAFRLVGHTDEAQEHADEVALYQMIRKQLRRTEKKQRREEDEERARAVRDLVERSIEARDAVDIYNAAGIDKPDISILNREFLKEFQSEEEKQSLRIRLLEKLLHDEIQVRKRKNLQKYRSLQEILEKTLKRYRRGTITAAEVMQAMVDLRQEMDEEDGGDDLGLSPEERAFLDAVVGLEDEAYEMPFLCDLVRDVVKAVKNNLAPDWTKPHRSGVKASVRSAIKRVLRKRSVEREHFRFIQKRVMEQAEALYEDWPKSA